jgi:hypothetical protein
MVNPFRFGVRLFCRLPALPARNHFFGAAFFAWVTGALPLTLATGLPTGFMPHLAAALTGADLVLLEAMVFPF